MNIRPALPTEAPALSELATRLFLETYTGQIPAADLDTHVRATFQPEAQLREITCPGGCVLVAVEGAELQAYASLRPGPPPGAQAVPDALEVARFYVAAPHHGTGLAAELMASCLTWAEREGRKLVWLQVWEANPRAIAFYGKLGFQDAGGTTYKLGNIIYCDRVMSRMLQA